MTETQAIRPAKPGNRMLRFTAFLFGGVAHFTFLFTIVYAIGFVSGLVVPKTIDTGAESPAFVAIVVNLALISLFAVQHSVMARNHSIFVGIALEERDIVGMFGDEYRYCRERVSMLFPWRKLI